MEIKHANHIEIKLPIELPLPTQKEIRERFEKLFGSAAPGLAPIIHPLAEETERLICQLLRPSEKPSTHPTVEIYLRHLIGFNSHTAKKTGYICDCGYDKINIGFKFCPQCSRKIIWINTHLLLSKKLKDKRK
jgi:hypothetical protein